MIKPKSKNQKKKRNIKFPFEGCFKKREGGNYQVIDLLT